MPSPASNPSARSRPDDPWSDVGSDLLAFLERPNIAVLATLRRDGSPSLSTVWYELGDDGIVRVSITRSRMKLRHIENDPRVAICVTTSEVPYKQVVVEGCGRIVEEDVDAFVRRVFSRYYGAREGEKYAEYSLSRDERLLLEIVPDRIHAWDFEVEDDHHQPWAYDTSGLHEAETVHRHDEPRNWEAGP